MVNLLFKLNFFIFYFKCFLILIYKVKMKSLSDIHMNIKKEENKEKEKQDKKKGFFSFLNKVTNLKLRLFYYKVINH